MDNSSATDTISYVFQTMRIEHTFLKEAHARFDSLRATRRQILDCPLDGLEAKGATLFADTQSGKTTILKAYLEKNVVDYCYEVGLFSSDVPRYVVASLQRVVVRVSVSGTSTLMSLLEDILRAYGDPRPQSGNLGTKKNRILLYMREFRTELLIFDEMNHLKIGAAAIAQRSEATRVHNTLKDFLLGGCPIVFVGTTEARDKVLSDKQIRARCGTRPLFLGPLVYGKSKHRKVFTEYCALLGVNLHRSGLFPQRSNFLKGDIVPKLFEASGGYLGHAANIVELAAHYAKEDGANCVERYHLSLAVDDYSELNELTKHNPFGLPEREESIPETIHV
ncbi:TniB family NTP-binding protein [Rhizobium ruizarguesonis]